MVLDTNLFVAANWNRGSSYARIIHQCLEGRLQPVVSKPVVREMHRILRQVRARPETLRSFDRFLDAAAEVEPRAVGVRAEDPDDQKFLECAAAGADYLISSDIHLLSIREVDGVPILKPSEFLAREAEMQKDAEDAREALEELGDEAVVELGEAIERSQS